MQQSIEVIPIGTKVIVGGPLIGFDKPIQGIVVSAVISLNGLGYNIGHMSGDGYAVACVPASLVEPADSDTPKIEVGFRGASGGCTPLPKGGTGEANDRRLAERKTNGGY